MARKPKEQSSTPNAPTPDQLGFEQAMAELEAIVEQMESKDTTLEQSLTSYERGIALVKRSRELLASAEQRFTEIRQQHENERG